METGDARFLKGHYVYKKVSMEENDSIRNRRKNGTPLNLQGQEFVRQPDRTI